MKRPHPFSLRRAAKAGALTLIAAVALCAAGCTDYYDRPFYAGGRYYSGAAAPYYGSGYYDPYYGGYGYDPYVYSPYGYYPYAGASVVVTSGGRRHHHHHHPRRHWRQDANHPPRTGTQNTGTNTAPRYVPPSVNRGNPPAAEVRKAPPPAKSDSRIKPDEE